MNEHGYEGVLAIRASADGVKLYFSRGKELPDPEKLLLGSGKQTRSIDLEGASTLALPAVARLIDEAIARNRVPFARAGPGSVVIRSTAAKQRRRASPRLGRSSPRQGMHGMGLVPSPGWTVHFKATPPQKCSREPLKYPTLTRPGPGASFAPPLPDGVMVAQATLTRLVLVRIQVGQPLFLK